MMSLNVCLNVVQFVCSNLCTNFFLYSKFVHGFLKFRVRRFFLCFDFVPEFVHEFVCEFCKLRKICANSGKLCYEWPVLYLKFGFIFRKISLNFYRVTFQNGILYLPFVVSSISEIIGHISEEGRFFLLFWSWLLFLVESAVYILTLNVS